MGDSREVSKLPWKEVREGQLRTPVSVWQEEHGRVHTPFEPVVLAATLLLIPVLILQADAEGAWLTFAYAANRFIWGVFALELATILVVASRKAQRFVRTGSTSRSCWSRFRC